MENYNIARIIRKFLSSRFPSDTEEKVQKWIVKGKDTQAKEKASLDYWNELEVKADSNTYAALERVNLRIGYNKEHLKNIVSYRKLTRVAAVIIPFFLLGGFLLYSLSVGDELIEVTAAYGEQKRLLLPDSSEIWLNAGSSIIYPKTFAENKRLVTLDGEAYFIVSKDTTKPFIVETSQLSVKVIGTKFNVRAYADDERISTTLTSGKVEVNVRSQLPRILQPNERLTYDESTSHIDISTVESIDTDSWIKGRLFFANATAEEIFRTLERRYNTTIENTLSIPATRRYTVKFLKDENLNEMLNILADIIGFTYQQNENKIIITK